MQTTAKSNLVTIKKRHEKGHIPNILDNYENTGICLHAARLVSSSCSGSLHQELGLHHIYFHFIRMTDTNSVESDYTYY